MNTKQYLGMAILISLTLTTGTCLVFQSIAIAPYFIALSGVCFYLLKSFKYGDNYFRSDAFDQLKDDGGIYLAGTKMNSTTAAESREDRFLEYFTVRHFMMRKFFSWILMGVGMYLFHGQLELNYSFTSIFAFVVVMMIIYTSSVGQILIPLLLNSIQVALGYSVDHQPAGYLFYALLLFVALAYLTHLQDDGFSRSKKFFSRKYQLIFLVGFTLLFFSVASGISYFLPNKDHKQTQIIQQARSLRKLGSLTSGALTKMEENLKEKKGTNPHLQKELLKTASQMRELSQKLSDVNIGPDELKMTQDQMEKLLADSKALSAEYDQELTKSLPDGIASELKLPDDKMELTREDIEKITAQLNMLKENRSLSSDEIISIQKINEQISGKQLHEIRPEALSSELSKLQELEQKRSVTEKQAHELKQKENKSENILKEAQAAESELKKKEEKPGILDALKKHWKLFIFISVILLASRWLGKKGIKIIEVAQTEDIQELKQRWKKLRRMKLSPRDEVIHYYNLLQESLQKIRYSDIEAPPSCIIYEDFREDQPELDKAAYAVTEIYSQCFYGKRQVNPKNLLVFRKALKRMLKVFKLA